MYNQKPKQDEHPVFGYLEEMWNGMISFAAVWFVLARIFLLWLLGRLRIR
jgi:hypothetical protein